MARIRNANAIKRKLLQDSECRVCCRPAANGHHLYPRGQGGDDVPENIIPLCGSGTTGCHGDVEAHVIDARRAVAFRLRPEERAYLVGKLGDSVKAAAWLARFYGIPEEAWQ